MNKKVKILLSVIIVSLSVFIILSKGQSKNSKIKYVPMQVIATEINSNNYLEKRRVTLNFEIENIIELNQKITEIESLKDKKEWFIAYKKIIDKYSYIIESPETIYDYFTEEELNLLFHVVQAEIGDEYSFEQKVNVCSVIFNRLEHERFPNTLSEILVYDQFSPIADGRYKEVEVSEDTILSCEYAFMIEDPTNGCLFFDSNNTLDYKFIFNDSAHNFYKYWEENE